MEKKQKKHVYRVTFYYHSNCDVFVDSDEELSREEAIAKAQDKRGHPKYLEQIHDGLQEVDNPDFADESARDHAFDKNGVLIECDDHVLYHDNTNNTWNAGIVYHIPEYFDKRKGARVLVATATSFISVKPKDCIVYHD